MFEMLEAFCSADFHQDIELPFSTHCRPFEALLNVFSTLLMLLSAKIFAQELFSPLNAIVLQVFNFLILSLNVFWVQQIGKKLLSSNISGNFAAIFFLLSTNASLYLSYALPNDMALCVFLFIVNHLLAVNPNRSLKKSQIVGFGSLSMVGFFVYPGYLPHVFLVVALLLKENSPLSAIQLINYSALELEQC